VVVGVMNDEPGVLVPQQLVDLVGQPRIVPELESGRKTRGQLLEELFEAHEVAAERGRSLEEHGAEPILEAGHGLDEIRKRLRRNLQLLSVGNPLRRLDREAKAFRRRRLPSIDLLRVGHPIERGVDLHGREAGGVELEELFLRKLLRIEGRPPFRIAEPRCADPCLRHG